jgi:hypothetical protein
MADDSVCGSFDAVGVVAGAFDDAGATAVTAWRVRLGPDFVEGVGVCGV